MINYSYEEMCTRLFSNLTECDYFTNFLFDLEQTMIVEGGETYPELRVCGQYTGFFFLIKKKGKKKSTEFIFLFKLNGIGYL